MAVTAARLVTVGAAPWLAAAGDEDDAVAAALSTAGIPVGSHVFVDEDEAELESALLPDRPFTVILAGPGGSAGDIVRRVLARLAGVRLVLNDRMLAALEETHRRHDRPLPRRAERLALLPQGAVIWPAGDGEPGLALDTARGAFAVLPRGAALADPLAGLLIDFARTRASARGATLMRTLRTTGVSLVSVEDRLADWLGTDGDVVVTTLPTDGEVWVRLRARGATAEAAAQALAAVEPRIAEVLGDDCYGRDAESLEQAVGRLLAARGLTLSVAESCTGGLLGHRLTNVAGSSAYFERGVVVYSNRAKQELLGVPEAMLRTHGAVSGPCAEAMARGIAERSGSACALAVTGIAGPEGGSPGKPVGTVFIGVAVVGEVTSRRCWFGGGRAAVKWQSTQAALDLLRRRLGGA